MLAFLAAVFLISEPPIEKGELLSRPLTEAEQGSTQAPSPRDPAVENFDPNWPQVCLEIRTIAADGDYLTQAGGIWSSGRAVVPAGVIEKYGSVEQTEIGVLEATGVGLRQGAAVSCVVNDEVMQRFINAAQAAPRVNLRFCPKVTVFQGDDATILEESVRPIATGVTYSERPSEGTVGETVADGFRISLQTDSHDAELYEITVRNQEVLGTSQVKMPTGFIASLPHPDVKQSVVTVRERIPEGHSLVCGIRSGTGWSFYTFTPQVIETASE